MKIKYLKINQQAISTLLSASLCIGAITGAVLYYQYENIEQICETDINNTNIFKSENDKFYCYFDVGEHIIKISRNDAYRYNAEEVDGYAIKDVEITGWKLNSKITYVNTVPVVVEATNEKNQQLEFSDFGVVSTEENKVRNYIP